MKAGLPWNLSGVDKDTREAVIEAARLSGMTVGQWLNQVLGENFAEPDLGGDRAAAPAAADDEDAAAIAKAIERLTERLGTMDDASRSSIDGLPNRLDEIEHRISRLSSLRQTGAERQRSLKGVADLVRDLSRDVDNADERARTMVEGIRARGGAPAARPAVISAGAVNDAINELEARIVEMRNRPLPQAIDAERPQKLDEIRARLDALLARSESAKPAVPASAIEEALAAIERRIDNAKAEIDLRLAEREAEPPAIGPGDIQRLEERLADIAGRLADNDALQAERLAEIAARLDASEAERKKPKKEAELAAAIREISSHQRAIDDHAETLAMRRDQKALAAAIAALKTDVGAITEQVSAISRVGNEQHGAFFEVAKHVESLASEKPIDRTLLNAIRGDLETMRGMIEGSARQTTALGSLEARSEGIAAQLGDLMRMTPDRGKLDALGQEVAALRDSLEADDSPRAIQRLEMKVAELGRSLEVAMASRQAGDPAVDRLEDRLAELATQMDGLRDTGAHTAAIHTVEQRLDSRLNEIADRLGGLANATPHTIATAEERLSGRLDELAGRLSGMLDEATRPQAEALERAQHQLETRLEEIVARLGGMLDTAPQKAAIDHVHERLSAITDRIDRLNASQKEPSAALDAIKGEIGALRREMSEKQSPQPPATDHLEKQLRDLARQLDTVSANKGGDQALAELENKVTRLAGEIEVTKPRMAELTTIERRLDKLTALLSDSAEQSVTSARSEAKKAVAELSDIVHNQEVDAQLVRGLMKELESLKHTSGDSDKDTRGKLESVSQTVAQVVDRLSVLETETVATATRAAKIRPPRVEPVEAAKPTPAVDLNSPSFAWTTAFRGAGNGDGKSPEPYQPPADSRRTAPLIATRGDGVGPSPSPATPERRAADRRADFIAAARRAAQAVAKEAAAMDIPTNAPTPTAEPEVTTTDDAMAPEAERRPGAFARISQAIRSRKRPLLLAAAAIVLAIGAMQAYGKFISPIAGRAVAEVTQPSAEVTVSQKAQGQVRDVMAEAGTAGPAVTAAGDAPTTTTTAADAASPPTAVAFAVPAPTATESHFGTDPVQPPSGSFGTPAELAAASNAPPLPLADSTAPATDAKPVVLASADGSIPTQSQQPATIAGLDAHLGSAKLLNAAAGGDGAAEFEIATRYAEGTVVPKDLAEAAKWYAKSADAGVAMAQYRLGSLYERGQGVPKDLTQAVNWYQRAADQGNVNAMHNLAVLMSEGVDGAPDHDKALQWFLAAGNYGVRDSQYNLGVIYARAIGVNQDLGESYKWFAIAAAQGDTDAAARRDEVAKVLSPDDLTKARAAVAAWHVKPPIAEANGVAVPPGGWDAPGEMLSDADRQALVSKIQTLLADAGYDVGPADGVAGPKTADAVKQFQQKQGVQPTGVIDNNLLAMLTNGK